MKGPRRRGIRHGWAGTTHLWLLVDLVLKVFVPSLRGSVLREDGNIGSDEQMEKRECRKIMERAAGGCYVMMGLIEWGALSEMDKYLPILTAGQAGLHCA